MPVARALQRLRALALLRRFHERTARRRRSAAQRAHQMEDAGFRAHGLGSAAATASATTNSNRLPRRIHSRYSRRLARWKHRRRVSRWKHRRRVPRRLLRRVVQLHEIIRALSPAFRTWGEFYFFAQKS